MLLLTLNTELTTLHHTDKLKKSAMLLFFENISDPLVDKNITEDLDACQWSDGVHCHVNGNIYSITFREYRRGNFDITFLPPTLKHLSIENCEQNFPINTRLFPKSMETICLSSNSIFGSVELRTLPELLKSLNLMRNDISGPIHLTDLPDKLEYIWLNGNRIQQDELYYAMLPRSVVFVSLNGAQHQIGTFWLLGKDGHSVQRSIKEVQKDRIEYIPKSEGNRERFFHHQFW